VDDAKLAAELQQQEDEQLARQLAGVQGEAEQEARMRVSGRVLPVVGTRNGRGMVEMAGNGLLWVQELAREW
jgi:hypothetical protein